MDPAGGPETKFCPTGTHQMGMEIGGGGEPREGADTKEE